MQNQSNIDQEAIAENIGRTVDKAALRKVRNLVDNVESEERAEKSRQFWVTVIFFVAAFGLIAATVTVSRIFKAEPKATAKISASDLQAECTTKRRRHLGIEREQELRGANPGMSSEEINRRLRAEAGTIYHAARQACERALGS